MNVSHPAILSCRLHAARRLKWVTGRRCGRASEEEITQRRLSRQTTFILGNLKAALSEEPGPGAERKLSDDEEALLVATACLSPRHAVPVGRLAAGRFAGQVDRA
jgi:hypothetical protein